MKKIITGTIITLIIITIISLLLYPINKSVLTPGQALDPAPEDAIPQQRLRGIIPICRRYKNALASKHFCAWNKRVPKAIQLLGRNF